MKVEYTPKGIYIPAADLWLDPAEPVEAAWLSHAHHDHARTLHGTVFATAETLELYSLRFPAARSQVELRLVEYFNWWERGKARLVALPAGHLLGAAQLLIEAGTERLLYTGDIKLKSPLVGNQQAQVEVCDHLIVESTYGIPIFRFLTADETRIRLRQFVDESHLHGYVPALIGYPLGRAQELAHTLSGMQYKVVVLSNHRYFPIFQKAGFRFENCSFVTADQWQPEEKSVLIISRSSRKNRVKANLRLGLVSGRACLSNTRAIWDVEELIPYSSHCDFKELLDFVKSTKARQVDVIHGYAHEFAGVLRRYGFQARAISTLPVSVGDNENEENEYSHGPSGANM